MSEIEDEDMSPLPEESEGEPDTGDLSPEEPLQETLNLGFGLDIANAPGNHPLLGAGDAMQAIFRLALPPAPRFVPSFAAALPSFKVDTRSIFGATGLEAAVESARVQTALSVLRHAESLMAPARLQTPLVRAVQQMVSPKGSLGLMSQRMAEAMKPMEDTAALLKRLFQLSQVAQLARIVDTAPWAAALASQQSALLPSFRAIQGAGPFEALWEQTNRHWEGPLCKHAPPFSGGMGEGLDRLLADLAVEIAPEIVKTNAAAPDAEHAHHSVVERTIQIVCEWASRLPVPLSANQVLLLVQRVLMLVVYVSAPVGVVLDAYGIYSGNVGTERIVGAVEAMPHAIDEQTEALVAAERASPEVVDEKAFVTTTTALRAEPDVLSDTLALAHTNQEVEIEAEKEGWVRVTFFDRTAGVRQAGWAKHADIQAPEPAGQTATPEANPLPFTEAQ